MVTFFPPLTVTPSKPFATLTSVVAAAVTPAMLPVDVTFRVCRPVQPDTSALVTAAAAVRLATSTFLTVAPVAAVKSPEKIRFAVSVPAPPSILSREEKAPRTPLMTSLPDVPATVSIPVVSVKIFLL